MRKRKEPALGVNWTFYILAKIQNVEMSNTPNCRTAQEPAIF